MSVIDSDNDFYDACDKLESIDLNKDDKFYSLKPDNHNDSEQEDFCSIKPDLDQNKGDKPFVPLHEQLNQEMNKNYEQNEEEEEEVINEDAETPNDPYYIDESLLKQEQENLNDEQKESRLKEAQENKQLGNDLFKQEKYSEALEYYTKSLRLCPLEFSKERSIFYSNRSVCYFKLKENEKCINECTKSIELDAEFVKPLLRRAECYQLVDKLEESFEDYKKLSEIEPKNMTHKQKILELDTKIKERNEKLKEEMFGKLKDLGNMVLKPFGLSTNNFQFVQDPNSGSYSVNFKK